MEITYMSHAVQDMLHNVDWWGRGPVLLQIYYIGDCLFNETSTGYYVSKQMNSFDESSRGNLSCEGVESGDEAIRVKSNHILSIYYSFQSIQFLRSQAELIISLFVIALSATMLQL